MLAEPGRLQVLRPDRHAFELKWDGFRGIVGVNGDLRVRSRRGWDMTSQGSVYGQFRRALDRGNGLIAVGLAKELPKLSLVDAVRLALVVRPDEKEFLRYATRWHARFVTEQGITSWQESHLSLTALLSMGHDPEPGISTLQAVFERHERRDLVAALRG